MPSQLHPRGWLCPVSCTLEATLTDSRRWFSGRCHLRSKDLLHWEELPLVLWPTSNPAIDPCVPTVIDTGSIALFPESGIPFALYSTVNRSSINSNFDGNSMLMPFFSYPIPPHPTAPHLAPSHPISSICRIRPSSP